MNKNQTSLPKHKPYHNPTTAFESRSPNSYGGNIIDCNDRTPSSKGSKPEQNILIPPKDLQNDTKLATKPPLRSSPKINQTQEKSISSVKSRTDSFEFRSENKHPTNNTASKSHPSPPITTSPKYKINNDVTSSITHPNRHTSSVNSTPAAGVVVGAKSGRKPGLGLKNLGNTCFMNCVLQCLSHTIPLRNYYASGEYKKSLKRSKGSLSAAFAKVLDELWSSYIEPVAPYEYVAPYDLKREVEKVAPRFAGYSQHNAQEFMRFLLNEVHEEINQADVKGRQSPAGNESREEALARYRTWEDSKVIDLFCGMLRSTISCTVCGKESTVFDPFMDLALPIPKASPTIPSKSYIFSISYDTCTDPPVSLAECFDLFTAKETLDDEERPYCNACKKSTKSYKQLSVAKLPDILVIQLKRFSGYTVRRKLCTPVKFEETWTLEDHPREGVAVKHRYSLYGIVSHSGGIFGGHYKAYCRYNDQWRCFNDSHMNGTDWAHVKSQEAYILFYERDVRDVTVSLI